MPDIKAFVARLGKYKGIKLNRNIANYLVCVVIASILWFLNTLNQDYSAELTYPIKYVNLPKDKYPVTPLPAHLQLGVRAKGFALLKHRVQTSFLPVTLNFNTYAPSLQKNGQLFEFTLSTNDIKEKIGGQLSSDIKLSNVYPEEILFQFAPVKSAKVAVRPNLQYTLKRQYILNQVSVTPDSVVVSGPAHIIDTLQSISTDLWTLKNANKSANRHLKVQEMEYCRVDKEEVEVHVDIEQFTEARRRIAIRPQGLPEDISMRLFPATVDITYEVGLSKYEEVKEADFLFTVDYPAQTHADYLEVKAAKTPHFIKNLTYSPQRVEFILEKK